MSKIQQTSCVIHSKTWRTEEVKTIFNLLRSEYNDSKSYNLLKRYKELERIIQMFTTDEVLMKVLWLTTGDIRSSRRNCGVAEEFTPNQDKYQYFNEKDTSDQLGKCNCCNTNDKITETSAPSTYFVTSLDLDPPSLSFFMQLYTTTSNLLKTKCPTVANQTSTSIPLVSTSSPYTKTCINSSKSLDLIDGNEANIKNRNSVSSIFCNFLKPAASDNILTDSNNLMAKRKGIEKCAIRRDEIPEFQIPQMRTVVKRIPQLDPSLYNDVEENDQIEQQKRTKKDMFKNVFKHLTANNTTTESKVDKCITYKSKFLSYSEIHLPRSMTFGASTNCICDNKNHKISHSVEFLSQTENNDFSMSRAYDSLRGMREKYSEMAGNKLTRFRQMKTLIKFCMDNAP